MFQLNDVSISYATKPVIRDVTLTVRPGEMLGILGPNGSGKTTLLKAMSDTMPVDGGEILLDGRRLETFKRKELAKTLAVLPQLHPQNTTYSVYETVSLGRYPHQTGVFSSWTSGDEEAVQLAMEQMGVTQYAKQPLDQLSGGEQQRVFMAQALAQQASVLLLDEPTNHLDIAHQQRLLDIVKQQTIDAGLTVVSVFHDINLAALYCDRLVLINDGHIVLIDEPHAVLKKEPIESTYHVRVSSFPHPEQPKPQLSMLPVISRSTEEGAIHRDAIHLSRDAVTLVSSTPLKTMSSAVHNAGTGWYRNFINRHVPATYEMTNIEEEMTLYLERRQFALTDTVAMMTAIDTREAVVAEYDTSFGSIVIMVTVGVGNAMDVSRAYEVFDSPRPGTINTWIIVNGHLSEEAFVQAMMTATEAKTKALQLADVRDPRTGTIATGTPTDSLLIAATQFGERLPYAGPLTELGRVLAHGVVECTMRAVEKYRE